MIVIGDREILDGGDISVKQGLFQDVSSYTITFYVISGKSEHVLLSGGITDEAGYPVSISGGAGRISNEKGLITPFLDDLHNHFYCKLVTESSDGKENTYILKLNLEEITK